MQNAFWRVRPHGPLQQLSEGVWTVVGSPAGALPLPRRMTVVRSASDSLLIFSAVCLDPPGMAALESLGAPRQLVVPNGQHRLDAPAYRARYPQVQVYCPAAARTAVAERVGVDADLEALPVTASVQAMVPPGLRGGDSALLCRGADGVATLVLNDLVFNLARPPGLGGWLLRALGSTGGPKITPYARRSLVADSVVLAAWLREQARVPELKRILVSHGDPIDTAPAQVLLDLADRLEGNK